MPEYASLHLYSWPTPNGQKPFIMLEETGLPYELHPIDITKGDQHEPGFLRISPNNKIPALVDMQGPGDKEIALFESGAILVYLAEKTGKFLSTDPATRYTTLQWLFFQVGSIGPMLGQAYHFSVFADTKVPYAIDRYTKEANRLYGVMDKHLSQAPYFAGRNYSIADISMFAWTMTFANIGIDIKDYPKVHEWLQRVVARDAVKRGMSVLKDKQHVMSVEAKEILFGK
ncbi:MAG TPA: glutathione S-transferase N-terminal domain-containing protein [Gammaproteobacteria bacterium]